MFIRSIHKKHNGKVYTTTYLAESYKDKDGKVRHEQILSDNFTCRKSDKIHYVEYTLDSQKIETIPERLQSDQSKILEKLNITLKICRQQKNHIKLVLNLF